MAEAQHAKATGHGRVSLHGRRRRLALLVLLILLPRARDMAVGPAAIDRHGESLVRQLLERLAQTGLVAALEEGVGEGVGLEGAAAAALEVSVAAVRSVRP
jgi:hypothetical protein